MNYDIVLVGLLIIIELAIFLFFFLQAYEKRTEILQRGYILRKTIHREKTQTNEKATEVL
jgi:hypothetical protein